jgi:hypothetical protein
MHGKFSYRRALPLAPSTSVRNRTNVLAFPSFGGVICGMANSKPHPFDSQPRARANRYRELATEAQRAAETTPFEEFREQYRTLASQWNDMAADLEASCGLA